MVKLSDLLPALNGLFAADPYQEVAAGLRTDPIITGIALDSRRVQPGNLFVALSGGQSDGHAYIPEALQRSAAAVVGEKPLRGLPVPYIRVTDSRLGLAHLSAAFYGYPARHLTMIGVTGTDGKTTTATLIYYILRKAGFEVGLISTVSAQIGAQVLDTGFHVTTPEAPEVQAYLAQMLAAGHTHAVLEATSHGLAQHRVAACEFDLGVATNITHEHLDFHRSYRAYRQAKARLFTGLAATQPKECGNYRIAILNRDDVSYIYLRRKALAASQIGSYPIHVISYGLHPRSHVRATQVEKRPEGMSLYVQIGGKGFNLQTRMAGGYNLWNVLAAIATTVAALGVSEAAAQDALADPPAIPGRMERVDLGQDFLAIVDFAHTPNALRQALLAAREMTAPGGRLIAVFGAAGLRDRMKRRLMAEEAAKSADLSILTAEDPRTESLEAILEEMAEGMRSGGGVEGRTFWRVPNRGQALRFGVSLARPGDVLIALGKGHEQSMCFGETEYAWDDRLALRAALAERLGLPGPPMPYLPTSQ